MRILAAVDLRVPNHEWIVGIGQAFAESVGAVLDLVFVLPEGASEADGAARASALGALVATLPEGIRGEALTPTGDIVEQLATLSERYQALVVGPREPGAIEALLMGTMATRVLRRAQCAVLIPRTAWPSDDKPPRLLVGVDLQAREAKMIVEQAARWAARLGGTLDAGYIDPRRLPYIGNDKIREKAERELQEADSRQWKALEELLDAIDPPTRGNPVVRHGEPEFALERLSHDYDLVLVGNKDRAGLQGMLLGSVGAHVARNAACNVITLPTRLATPEVLVEPPLAED